MRMLWALFIVVGALLFSYVFHYGGEDRFSGFVQMAGAIILIAEGIVFILMKP